MQLAEHWSIFHYRVRGRTVLDHYLEQRGRRLAGDERAWLTAQPAAWLSIWEVVAVDPGTSLTMRDLLSHQTRLVSEASGSRTLVVRDAILGRVVDHAGRALLCGVHPRPLPPIEAAAVVERARKRVRRRHAVPIEKLREETVGRSLIRSWEEAVERLDARRAIPPTLQNTDGDPLVLTVDHFEVAPGAMREVAGRLAALDGVEAPDAARPPLVYVFVKPGNPRHASWESTVIGRAVLAATALTLETNSRERANALRARVEAACADRIRHRAREHADPLSSRAPRDRSGPELEPPPPEIVQLLLDHKRRHYSDWADQPLPALGGKTPREMARTAGGRAALDVLLKDMENAEQRSSGASGAAFDFSGIRAELGL